MTANMTHEQADVRVVFAWRDAGTIGVDASGRLTFPALPSTPGLYRMTLTGAAGQTRPRVYIGETDLLARRMQHYRTPGGRGSPRGQKTNIRLNDELRALLAAGGGARLAIATAATVSVAGAPPVALDLATKAARVLAEHAALVAAQLAGDVDIANA
jgi:hypothetical protein